MSHSRYVRKHYVPGTGYSRYANIKHGEYRKAKERLKKFEKTLKEISDDELNELISKTKDYGGPTVEQYLNVFKQNKI